MGRFPATAALLCLALVACGSRQVVLSPAGVPTAPVPTTSTPLVVPSTAAPSRAEVERAIAAVRASQTPRPSGSKKPVDYGDDFGPGKGNTMPLKVTLDKACVQPGQTISATAVTLRNAKLAFAAAYSDNDFVPSFTYVPGEGNPTGTFTWTWEITPNTPTGDGMVSTVAAKQKRGATYKNPFTVATRC